jgi:WD40 repeat protein
MKCFLTSFVCRWQTASILLIVLAIHAGPIVLGQEDRIIVAPDKRQYNIEQVAIAPNGAFFAGVHGHRVLLYDTSSGKLLKSKEFKPSLVTIDDFNKPLCLDFSPDGKYLAVCYGHDGACLWEMEGDHKIIPLKGHKGPWVCERFSPDGTLLATGDGGGRVLLWDVAQRKVKLSLNRNKDSMEDVSNCVAFSPDGKLVASGSGDETIKLWNVATGKKIRIFRGPEGDVQAVAFTPDGKTFLSSHVNGKIGIWDVETERETGVLTGPVGSDVADIIVLPDNQTIIVAENSIKSNKICVWDLKQKKQLHSVASYKGYQVLSMAMFPGQKQILCGENNDTFELISVAQIRGETAKTGEKTEEATGTVPKTIPSPNNNAEKSGIGKAAGPEGDTHNRR